MARVRQELPRQVILRQRPLARNRTRSHNGVKMDSKSTYVPNVATFALTYNSFSVRFFARHDILSVSRFSILNVGAPILSRFILAIHPYLDLLTFLI